MFAVGESNSGLSCAMHQPLRLHELANLLGLPEQAIFSRLTSDSLNTVYRLETNILRLFLVYAMRQGKQEVVRDFFEKMADALQDKKDWKDWFGEMNPF